MSAANRENGCDQREMEPGEWVFSQSVMKGYASKLLEQIEGSR